MLIMVYFKSVIASVTRFGSVSHFHKTSALDNIIKQTHRMKYLNQKEATELDLELFNKYKFSVDQLMELAGLSCSHAIAKCFPQEKYKNILICCGPGNNGGDGLVCARHLFHMNYSPTILYIKETDKELYKNLKHQCMCMGIQFVNECPNSEQVDKQFSLIVDAIFGFSFRPPVREQFTPIMKTLKNAKTPIASIDIPSGWDIESEPNSNDIQPELLISLTAPKICAQHYRGKYHYLGGRFLSDEMKKKYHLILPDYSGTDQVVQL